MDHSCRGPIFINRQVCLKLHRCFPKPAHHPSPTVGRWALSSASETLAGSAGLQRLPTTTLKARSPQPPNLQMDGAVSKWTRVGPSNPPNPNGQGGLSPTLQMHRSVSKWTRVGSPPTLHDLRQLPNLQKWAKGGGTLNLSGLGAGRLPTLQRSANQ